MTFIAIAVIAFLIFLMTRRYRRVLSVVIASTIILSLTTAALWWGMNQLAHQDMIRIFNAAMDRRAWFALIAAWYAGDAVAVIRIMLTLRSYKILNKPRG